MAELLTSQAPDKWRSSRKKFNASQHLANATNFIVSIPIRDPHDLKTLAELAIHDNFSTISNTRCDHPPSESIDSEVQK